jgi:hypothetical protein
MQRYTKSDAQNRDQWQALKILLFNTVVAAIIIAIVFTGK